MIVVLMESATQSFYFFFENGAIKWKSSLLHATNTGSQMLSTWFNGIHFSSFFQYMKAIEKARETSSGSFLITVLVPEAWKMSCRSNTPHLFLTCILSFNLLVPLEDLCSSPTVNQEHIYIFILEEKRGRVEKITMRFISLCRKWYITLEF